MNLLTLNYYHSTWILTTATILRHICVTLLLSEGWIHFFHRYSLWVSILIHQPGFTCLDMLLMTHYCWRESKYYSYYLVFKHFPYFSTALSQKSKCLYMAVQTEVHITSVQLMYLDTLSHWGELGVRRWLSSWTQHQTISCNKLSSVLLMVFHHYKM